MKTYNNTHEDFERFIEENTMVWPHTLQLNPGGVYDSRYINDLWILWQAAWKSGNEIAHSRIGINDEIDPSLMTKRLRDWA